MGDTPRFDNAALNRLAQRPGVAVGAAMPVDDFVAAVLREWRDADPRAGHTITRMGEVAVRFARRLHTSGVDTVDAVDPAGCAAFIDAPTRTGAPATTATRHFRRVTLRAVFRTGRRLGVLAHDPTIDLALPPRTTLAARPLTDDEIVLCRTCAFPRRALDHRRAAAWALAEAAAGTGEVPPIRRRDLHGGPAPTAVDLPGTRRLEPRTVALTDWGAAILTRRLSELPAHPDAPLVYTGDAPDGSVAQQAAVCSLVAATLAAAGLDREPDVRPASVRHWRARSAFDDGAPIEAVARLLGQRSLDDTARAIGHDWWTP